jgi:hypothetical protein
MANGRTPRERAVLWIVGAAILLAVVIVFFGIGYDMAGAQEVADTTVDVGNWAEEAQPYILAILGPLVATLVSVLAVQANRWLGWKIEGELRDGLQTAIHNAAGLAVARGVKAAAGAQINVRSQAVADAIAYVEKSAPDALKHFDITPESLREKIEAKIPQIMPPIPELTVGELAAPLQRPDRSIPIRNG